MAIAVAGLGTIAASMAAGVTCARAVRRIDGRIRLGWSLLGAGMVMWGLGECIWASYDLVLHKEVPYPSLADAGFLVAVPLVFAGMVGLLAEGMTRYGQCPAGWSSAARAAPRQPYLSSRTSVAVPQ